MEEYLGMIKLFAGTFAPRGWMFCDGTRLEVGRWNALYSLLGETYGGDGYSFNLPDLRGCVPVGVVPGQPGDYYLGGKGGKKTTKITTDQLPAHSHTATSTATATSSISVSNAEADSQIPTADASVIAAPVFQEGREKNPVFGYNAGPANTKLGASSGSVAVTVNTAVNNTGTGADLDLRQPYMGMNYIICVEGIYPPRP